MTPESGDGPCVWCQTRPASTDDHVFPDSLGGTRDFTVPACADCQARLSVAERELARRSDIGLMRQARDFVVKRRKLRKDPASGAFVGDYILRRRADGGFDETGVRGGKPVQLASVELDVSGIEEAAGGLRIDPSRLSGARRGPSPADVNRLIDLALETLRSAPNQGTFNELPVQLLDDGPEPATTLIQDPGFRPRVFLDLSGRPRVRARDASEARRFLALLQIYGEALKTDGVGWVERRTPAGVEHESRLVWNFVRTDRVIAKIAYALAVTRSPSLAGHPDLQGLREFVRAGDADQGLVKRLTDAGSSESNPEGHVAAVDLLRGELVGFVALFGSCHRVRIADSGAGDWPGPISAICVPGQSVTLDTGNSAHETFSKLMALER